jgi:type IX secretion system PorP/SprF family membrane protein
VRRLVIYIAFFFFVIGLKAQDARFTQFFNDPLYTNPALTGNFLGKYRFGAHYRHQWASVTRAFQTGGVSADIANILPSTGVGLMIYNDLAGDGDYSNTQISVPLSYTFKLSADSTQRLTLGAQPVFQFQQLNFGDFFFDDQYDNGSFNPSIPTAETVFLQYETQRFFNLHAGAVYTSQKSKREYFQAGLAVHNALEPENSWFGQTAQMNMRYSVHANAAIKFTEGFNVNPGIRYMRQGPHQEIMGGANFAFHFSDSPFENKSIEVGPWYRHNDAAILYAGAHIDKWKLGLSYDINISSLERASNNRGAWEIALLYTIEYIKPDRNKFKNCPTFL